MIHATICAINYSLNKIKKMKRALPSPICRGFIESQPTMIKGEFSRKNRTGYESPLKILILDKSLVCMKRFIYVLLIVLASCSQYDFEKEKSDEVDFLFQYEYRCGWCFGKELLTINGLDVSYGYYPYCMADSAYDESKLNEVQLAELKLDSIYDQVKVMSVNSCGVCYDGCDETLRFISASDTISITFDREKDVENLLPYIEKIRQLRDEFKTWE